MERKTGRQLGNFRLYHWLITPDIGYMAVILDSEGNRIALHSRN